MAMTVERMEQFRHLLDAMDRRLRGDIESLEEAARTGLGGEAGGDLSNAPMHLGDLGTAQYLQELNATLYENEEYIRLEVRDALADHRLQVRLEQLGVRAAVRVRVEHPHTLSHLNTGLISHSIGPTSDLILSFAAWHRHQGRENTSSEKAMLVRPPCPARVHPAEGLRYSNGTLPTRAANATFSTSLNTMRGLRQSQPS